MCDEVHCINPLSIAHLPWGPQGYEKLEALHQQICTHIVNPIIIIKYSIIINEDNVIKQHI